MKYFLDQEFNTRFKKPISWLPTIGKWNKPFHIIELISIGLVSDDDRQLNMISKDFDIKAAWNAYQLKQVSGDQRNRYPEGVKDYWLRENVLLPIMADLLKEETEPMEFNYKNFKKLIKKYGKTNKEIAAEVIEFTRPYQRMYYTAETFHEIRDLHNIKATEKNNGLDNIYSSTFSNVPHPDFYTYFGAYDWVLFCSLFGTMNQLPQGFPYYAYDIKQMLDEILSNADKLELLEALIPEKYSVELFTIPFEDRLGWIQKYVSSYPAPDGEHNALSDAIFNKKLYTFLSRL